MNRNCMNIEGSSSSSSVGGPPHLSVILTVRLLMQGKEVGSIIGKRGDHIKSIRDNSGAKINISDGSSPERIVTITGSSETINKAFEMICSKLQQDLQAQSSGLLKPPITMRLIVPATQCGSIIGKRGCKIKEIREATGASIQVASEMLPSSTERAVTISGSADAIVLCMQQICHILLEAPAKGNTLSYRPKPTFNPSLLASSAAAAAASLMQPYKTVLNPMDLVKVASPYVATQLLPTIPVFNPYAVLGNGLISSSSSASTKLETSGGAQPITTMAPVAITAGQWFNFDEKQQAELAQAYAAQPYAFSANMLFNQPMAQFPKMPKQHDATPNATHLTSLMMQQNSRRYAPY